MIKTAVAWHERFKLFFLNNRFVLFLLVLLLIGLNIMVLKHISFVFLPVIALVKTVMFPLVLTGIVYYLSNPIIDYLERNGIRRVYAILFLYVFFIAFITLLVLIVLPSIRQQIQGLIDNFPAYSDQTEMKFKKWIGSGFFEQMQETFNFDPAAWLSKLSERFSSLLDNAWKSVSAVVGAITEVILAIVTLPFILFYLLKDGKRLPGYMLQFVPSSLRDPGFHVLSEMSNQISTYIRGQLIVSFCIGGLLYIGYLIIGLDYSLVLAIFAACTSIVPYLGPAIAITPALIVAIVTSPFMLLKMVVIWTVVQLVEGKFISPQIMGKSLDIHPITIIFVILTSGKLFGVLGVILAIPGYAVLKVICTHLFRWFKVRSGLYRQTDQRVDQQVD